MNVLQFSLGDIMVRGSTTIFELGLGSPEMVEAIGQTGIRAYIGLMARAGVFMTKDGFKPYYEWDEPNAFKRLEETLRRRDQYDGPLTAHPYWFVSGPGGYLYAPIIWMKSPA